MKKFSLSIALIFLISLEINAHVTIILNLNVWNMNYLKIINLLVIISIILEGMV